MEILWMVVLGAVWVIWKLSTAKPKSGKRGKSSGSVQKNGVSVFGAQAASPATELVALEWSGVSPGVLPIKSLTGPQRDCLVDASYRQRVLPSPPSEIDEQRPAGIAAHPTKTVMSLLKHGMVEPDGTGTYRITDKGLFALQALNTRY